METFFRSQDNVKTYLKMVASISSQFSLGSETTVPALSLESVERFCDLSTTEEKITQLINSAQNSEHTNAARLLTNLLVDMYEFTQNVEFPPDVRETSREMISNLTSDVMGTLGTLGSRGALEHVSRYFSPLPNVPSINTQTPAVGIIPNIGQILEAPPLPRHNAIDFEPSPLTEEEDDTKACPVCHVHAKTHALTCGHQYCSECCNFISREKKCPTCRKSVSHIIKLY